MHNIASNILLPYRLLPDSPQKPTDYIEYIHKECLSIICNECDLKGLVYYGGPEVVCENSKCNKEQVFCCVYRDKSDKSDREIQCSPLCKKCRGKCDVNKWLVSF